MSCNYCGFGASIVLAEYTRFGKNKVLQCRKCGLVYLDVRGSKSEIESYYASDYRRVPIHQRLSADEHFHHKVTQNDAENRIRFIAGNLEIRSKRILEIGSATGRLLQKLAEYGCGEAIGIELGEEHVSYARGLGLAVITRPIEELGLREELDAIVSFHTLEHVYDPMAVMQAAYTGLKQGGCILGEVPNQDDWRIRIFDDEVVRRLHYDPDHYYYYSPVTLRNYLDAVGFIDIRLESVERYDSLLELRDILHRRYNTGGAIEEIVQKRVLPEGEDEDRRLPHVGDPVETCFNKIFARAVNSELMGNCLRFVAFKR